MKVKDGLVLLAYSAMCVMNERCPTRESEGTVVYTAEYRLMFSYGMGGGGVGKMEGEIDFKDGRKEGRKGGQMVIEGRVDLVGQDKRDKLYLRVPSLDSGVLGKCQNT